MGSWHFQWYLSAKQMWHSNQVHCFPFLFFFAQPLLCCAVELEGPDATAALNTSVKCKPETNAAAVPPPLIVSGALLSPGPMTFGLHRAALHAVCYCSWTRQHWNENSNLVLLLCDFFNFPTPSNFGPLHFSLLVKMFHTLKTSVFLLKVRERNMSALVNKITSLKILRVTQTTLYFSPIMFSHTSVQEPLYCFNKNRAHNTSDCFVCNFSHSVIYLYSNTQVFIFDISKQKKINNKDTINFIGIVGISSSVCRLLLFGW